MSNDGSRCGLIRRPYVVRMTHGHSHRGGDSAPETVEVSRLPRAVLLGFLLASLFATVVGTFALWPDADELEDLRGEVSFAADGVTFPRADVVEVAPACASLNDPPQGCGTLTVRVAEGVDAGAETEIPVPPEVTNARLAPGDQVQLIRSPSIEGEPAQFAYYGIERDRPLALLAALFALVVVVVARWRGVMALVGLGVAGAVLGYFVVPGLVTGESPLLVVLVGSCLIMYVVLYSTHGFSMRTSSALAGTLGGVALTAFIGSWAVRSSHLTGVVDEAGGLLTSVAFGLNFQELLVASVVIAGLGILNDVTITQASAVWELRAAGPMLTRRVLFTRAMRIGRDHVASTIYTIVFAYAGAALLVLLVVALFNRPLLDLMATEEISTELVRSFATSIGLVLAMPLTTAIAVATVPGPQAAADQTAATG